MALCHTVLSAGMNADLIFSRWDVACVWSSLMETSGYLSTCSMIKTQKGKGGSITTHWVTDTCRQNIFVLIMTYGPLHSSQGFLFFSESGILSLIVLCTPCFLHQWYNSLTDMLVWWSISDENTALLSVCMCAYVHTCVWVCVCVCVCVCACMCVCSCMCVFERIRQSYCQERLCVSAGHCCEN